MSSDGIEGSMSIIVWLLIWRFVLGIGIGTRPWGRLLRFDSNSRTCRSRLSSECSHLFGVCLPLSLDNCADFPPQIRSNSHAGKDADPRIHVPTFGAACSHPHSFDCGCQTAREHSIGCHSHTMYGRVPEDPRLNLEMGNRGWRHSGSYRDLVSSHDHRVSKIHGRRQKG